MIKEKVTKEGKSYYSGIRLDIISLFPQNVNIMLDIGCGEGYTSKYFKEKYNINCVEGVEIVANIADKAKHNLDKVYNINIEKISDFSDYFGKKYDCILLLDVLEHLLNPEEVLINIRSILSKNGFVIISLPNIRHYRALFPLLFFNEWNYTNAGPLDKTHLRFFTIKSMRKILYKSGYEILIEKPKKSYTKFFTMLNIIFLGALSDFSILQYIFLCRIKNDK